MRAVRWRAGIAVALVVVMAAAGCGRHHARETADGSVPPPVCAAVAVGQHRILGPAGITFHQLVDDRAWDRDERDGVAAIRLVHASRAGGRFEPLLDHLDARSRALDAGRPDGSAPGPSPTPSVRRLADDLDRLLARHGCPP